jgi:hypothetical protein
MMTFDPARRTRLPLAMKIEKSSARLSILRIRPTVTLHSAFAFLEERYEKDLRTGLERLAP